MEFNQFNPSSEEVEAIKLRNKYLPEDKRICYKCGHQYSICGWCDRLLLAIDQEGNWEDVDLDDVEENGDLSHPHACCDMECSYL